MADQNGHSPKTPKTLGPGTWSILSVVALIVIVIFFYRGGVFIPNATTNNSNSDNKYSDTNINTPSANTNGDTNGRIENAGWLTYKNDELGFGFMYPNNWQFAETQRDKFCRPEVNPLDGTCTSTLVSLHGPSPFKNSITLSLLGSNPNGLTINEWRREIQKRTVDWEYVVDMGSFEGRSLEEIGTANYQISTSSYFTVATDVFSMEWYDREQRDDKGYSTFVQILKTFRQM